MTAKNSFYSSRSTLAPCAEKHLAPGFKLFFQSCWRAPVSHKRTWLAVVNFSTVTHWNGWAIYYCCAGTKPAWETMEDSSGIFPEDAFQRKWKNRQ